MRRMFFCLALLSASFISCGASKLHVDKISESMVGITRIATADNVTLTSLSTALLESGKIDESTIEGTALAAKLRATQQQASENRTNLRVLGYAIQEAIMAMTTIPAEERAVYISDLATILGTLGKK